MADNTTATAMRPPSKVQIEPATKTAADGIKAKLDEGEVPKGEFISDGKTYKTDVDAKAARSKVVRYLTATYGLSLRTRTWEIAKGQWVFGVRPK